MIKLVKPVQTQTAIFAMEKKHAQYVNSATTLKIMHAQPVIPPARYAKQMWKVQAFVWTAKINTHLAMKYARHVQPIAIDAFQVPIVSFAQLDTISKLLIAALPAQLDLNVMIV